MDTRKDLRCLKYRTRKMTGNCHGKFGSAHKGTSQVDRMNAVTICCAERTIMNAQMLLRIARNGLQLANVRKTLVLWLGAVMLPGTASRVVTNATSRSSHCSSLHGHISIHVHKICNIGQYLPKRDSLSSEHLSS